MNVNQIINMVVRVFMRKFLSRGIDAGMNYFSSRKGDVEKTNTTIDPKDQALSNASKQSAKRVRQAAKLGRRIGRF